MPSKRDKIRLISSEGTGHFYTTDKNKKNTPDKWSNKSSAPQGWLTPKSSSAPSPPKSMT
mgnify:CR=1 FL=1